MSHGEYSRIVVVQNLLLLRSSEITYLLELHTCGVHRIVDDTMTKTFPGQEQQQPYNVFILSDRLSNAQIIQSRTEDSI